MYTSQKDQSTAVNTNVLNDSKDNTELTETELGQAAASIFLKQMLNEVVEESHKLQVATDAQ